MVSPPRHQRAVVKALLAFASEEGDGPDYTSDRAADRFVRTDNNAFLFGVLFDQLIDYERAWTAPHELRTRLGHWNMKKLASTPLADIRRAIKGSARGDGLARYPAVMAKWVKAAARKLVDECHGEAGSIWQQCLTAGEAIEWLREFEGVGQKKANMAARILHEARASKRFKRWDQINVAVDTHVRRVFQRAGLVDSPADAEILAAATRLHPRYPGALDEPVWRIGRAWCRPKNPDCDGTRYNKGERCPIQHVCPKLGIRRSRSMR